jgi:hypothetical protein
VRVHGRNELLPLPDTNGDRVVRIHGEGSKRSDTSRFGQGCRCGMIWLR